MLFAWDFFGIFMGLIRLLTYLAIGYFIWQFVQNYLKKQELESKRRAERKSQAPTPIVKCEQCQVHLPETEAFASGSRWFCSEEHRSFWLKSHR